jgi:DNA repair exonuclease SbcCD ATPase subunit
MAQAAAADTYQTVLNGIIQTELRQLAESVENARRYIEQIRQQQEEQSQLLRQQEELYRPAQERANQIQRILGNGQHPTLEQEREIAVARSLSDFLQEIRQRQSILVNQEAYMRQYLEHARQREQELQHQIEIMQQQQEALQRRRNEVAELRRRLAEPEPNINNDPELRQVRNEIRRLRAEIEERERIEPLVNAGENIPGVSRVILNEYQGNRQPVNNPPRYENLSPAYNNVPPPKYNNVSPPKYDKNSLQKGGKRQTRRKAHKKPKKSMTRR